LPEGEDVSGAVLADQPRSISWEKRPTGMPGGRQISWSPKCVNVWEALFGIERKL